MHRLTLQLRAVLETAAFLFDIGFTCEEIEASLGRARRYAEIDLQREPHAAIQGQRADNATHQKRPKP